MRVLLEMRDENVPVDILPVLRAAGIEAESPFSRIWPTDFKSLGGKVSRLSS
jgi:hypothetical protein